MTHVFEMRTLVRESIEVARDGRTVMLSIPIEDGWTIRLTERQAKTLYAGLQREKLGDSDGALLQQTLEKLSNSALEIQRLNMHIRALKDDWRNERELLDKIRDLVAPEDEE